MTGRLGWEVLGVSVRPAFCSSRFLLIEKAGIREGLGRAGPNWEMSELPRNGPVSERRFGPGVGRVTGGGSTHSVADNKGC